MKYATFRTTLFFPLNDSASLAVYEEQLNIKIPLVPFQIVKMENLNKSSI